MRQDAEHSRRDAGAPLGIGWAAKGVEEGAGGVGGTIAMGLGPVFGPLDVILVGGGLDGQCNEPLEEALSGRGSWLPVRRNI